MKTRDYAILHRCLGVGRAALTTFAGLVAGLAKVNPDDVESGFGAAGSFFAALLTSTQKNAWWVAPALLLLAWFVSMYRKWLGDPVAWKELQKLADDFRTDVFGKMSGQYLHQHRVTFYRRQRRLWGWPLLSHWLIPYVRSGHTSKSNVRRFPVNIKRPGQRNGIAGRAWECNGPVEALDKPRPNGDGVLEADWQAYAVATNVGVQDAKKFSSSSRSFWAVRVQVQGEDWGVLVIDTVNKTLDTAKAHKQFKTHARSISLLLLRS